MFLAPIITRIERVKWPADLLTWVQAPQPAPNPIPPRQSDWPNPVLSRPNLDLRGWIQSPLTTQGIPFIQRDWPNPVLPRANYDLRGWVQSPLPTATAIPNAQRDWPNPRGFARSIDVLSWTQSAPPHAPGTAPFAQYDWPNPTLQRASYDLRGWIQSPLPAATAIPNAQRDWPNPKVPARSLDSLSWISSALPSLPPPFAQHDWPNPILARTSFDLRGWIQSPAPSPNAIPIGQHDWPNPRPFPRSLDALTWTTKAAPAAVTPPAPAQYDWPNPVLAKINLELRGWIRAPQPSPTGIPFHQYDWPNPHPLPPLLELRTWASSVFLSAPVVAVPNVLGLNLLNAQAAITAAGLIPVEGSYVYSGSYVLGLVAAQSPLGGTFAPAGSIVIFNLSLGAGPPAPAGYGVVPNVLGMFYYDAQLALLGAGFRIAFPRFKLPASPAFLPQYVIGQSIPGGAIVALQTLIKIDVNGFTVVLLPNNPTPVP